jgi:hypothetical protein
MKRKSAWLSFAACALMATHPVKAASEKTTAATPMPKALATADFSRVEVMSLEGGNRIGFFDRGTGTLYIYNPTLTKCVGIKKLKDLGEPAESITP